MAGRFSVEAIFKAVDKVTAPVSRMQAKVQRFTQGMNRGFYRLSGTVDKFAAGVRQGALAAVASLALTSGAMAGVISTGADFEQTLVAAAAKFPGEIRRGTEAFQQLEDAARHTGATTEFTASQSAQALNFLAMAGFDAEASIAALPGVVDLATAAQVDLATATDVASDSLGAFGLMTKDATQLGANLARINDVIAKTTTTANTTVESLFETIKDGAPVATTAGASLETFAALAGELANSGIKGSQAGTTLKNMFLSLSAPTAGAAKILSRLGVQTKNAEGNMRDIVDILGDLNSSLDGLGTADRSGVLEGIFGRIPIAGVNVLLASGAKRLDEYRGQLEKASGASRTMATTMRDTLQGRLNSLNSAIEGVKISIFGLTRGPLNDVVDQMTNWVRANEQLIATKVGEFLASVITHFDEIVKVGRQIAGVVALFFALSMAIKVLGAATAAVNLVMAAFGLTVGAFKVAMAAALFVINVLPKALMAARLAMLALNLAMALNPIGLLVTAVGLLVAAAGAIVLAWEPVSEFFASLWSGITKQVDDIISEAKKVAEFFGFEFENTVKANLPEIPNAADLGPKPVENSLEPAEDPREAPAATAPAPQMVSPQERVARSVEEQRSTSTAEVTIKDESGRAEVTDGKLGPGLKLQQAGAF